MDQQQETQRLGYCHLHCHTEYSLLDGALKIQDIMSTAKTMSIEHVCITDHGTLHGIGTFYDKALKAKLHPVLGCEMYVCPDHTVQSPPSTFRHLVLLAQNEVGFKNLLRLGSIAAIKGFYYRPRIDKMLLREYSEGLIALTACIQGEIPRAILESEAAGIQTAQEYLEIFGDRLYLEMQYNGIEEQDVLNRKLWELGQKLSIPVVATNDCHYLKKEDAKAHEALLCIQTKASLSAKNRFRFNSDQLYYASPEEMAERFVWCPEAVAMSVEIASRCEVSLSRGKYFFPLYHEDQTPEILQTEFRQMVRDGFEHRIAEGDIPVEERNRYEERLEYEIRVIEGMGFAGYFLIVQDFINWAKGQKIPVGPGRGSAAGSLAVYCLRITNLNPLPWNLLFERFLNAERVSLPDIDVDFCERRREEVIAYMTRRYGKDRVAQISTFGTMKARMVIKDVGRALDYKPAETDRLAKLVPEELSITLERAIEQSPDLSREAQNESIAYLLKLSSSLEGLSRHASTHAAGLVVSPGPMTDYVPLYKDKRGNIVAQFDMKNVEASGLVKFDFLGLKTMTVISDACNNAMKETGIELDMDRLKFDDPAVYALYGRGETAGIFQVESAGMSRYLMRMHPSGFEDLIAMLALYRPGPLGSGMVDAFIRRKHGEEAVDFFGLDDLLRPILEPTYGIIVYQEQVMQIAQALAGYTLGGADLLRRAMGKKQAEAMAAERTKFVEGGVYRGIDRSKMGQIFDLMEKFAEYGFNKSHSAAYAVISYQTAWLKLYHPACFMAALLTSEMQNQDKLLYYIQECRRMNIRVYPPKIGVSQREFVARNGIVYCGLGGILGVGDTAVIELTALTNDLNPPSSLPDMMQRVRGGKVNSRVIQALIASGACDDFGPSRRWLSEAAGEYQKQVTFVRKKEDKKGKNGPQQGSLFSFEEQKQYGIGVVKDTPLIRALPKTEWSCLEKARREKAVLGYYLQGHPLGDFVASLPQGRLLCQRGDRQRYLNPVSLRHARDFLSETCMYVAGQIVDFKAIITKKGEVMGCIRLADMTDIADILVFAKDLATLRGGNDKANTLNGSEGTEKNKGNEGSGQEQESPSAEEKAGKEKATKGIVLDPFPEGRCLWMRVKVSTRLILTDEEEGVVVTRGEKSFSFCPKVDFLSITNKNGQVYKKRKPLSMEVMQKFYGFFDEAQARIQPIVLSFRGTFGIPGPLNLPDILTALKSFCPGATPVRIKIPCGSNPIELDMRSDFTINSEKAKVENVWSALTGGAGIVL